MRLRPSLVPLAALCLAAVPAIAATPESGSVSKDAPSVKWEGAATGYGVIPINLFLETAGQAPLSCEAPSCDSFALKVADKFDLDVLATSRSGSPVEMHVVKPDGEVVVARDPEADKVKIRVKGAAPGDYTVEVLTNDSAEQSGEYDASATLLTGAAPSGGPGTPPAGPAPPNPGAPPQPQPGQPASTEPAASLGLATKAVSSRRSKKRMKLAVTSSKPVTDFRIVVKKGKKVISRGRLASLDGKGNVALKVRRKLKRGTYSVAMTAREGSRLVGATAKLKVKK